MMMNLNHITQLDKYYTTDKHIELRNPDVFDTKGTPFVSMCFNFFWTT